MTARLAPSGLKFIVLLLLLISLLGVFPLDVILPSFPALADSFDVSLKQIAFSVSIFAIGVAVSQLIIGPLSDAMGRKRLLLGGLVISIVGSLGCVFSRRYEEFMVFRLVQAVGCGSFVLSQALVQDLYADRQHTLRILMLTATGLLISLSPLAGSVLQYYLGWKGSFYIFSALALVVLVLTVIVLPERPSQSLRGAILVNVKVLMADRGFLVGSTLSALAFACHFAFVVISPLMMIGGLGLTEFMFAVVFVGYGVAYVVGGLVAVKLKSIMSPYRQMGCGLALIGSAGLMLLVWQVANGLSLPSLMVPVAISTIGVAIIRPAATTYALSRHAERAGAATSASNIMLFAFGGVVSTLIASIESRLPIVLALVFVGSSLVGGWLLQYSRRYARSGYIETLLAKE